MTIRTTTIGAYPKPDYVPIPDWFREDSTLSRDPTAALTQCEDCRDPEVEDLLDRATREVVEEQVRLGIDVPTDGEIRRENYIHYHCRRMDGIDFAHLTEKRMRDGQWVVSVPTITGPVRAGAGRGFLVRDWQVAQAATTKPLKITLPGPMTITDSISDQYYANENTLATDLANALNSEIRCLAEAGCLWIQVDEPVFARKPEDALAYGIENLERCFHGLPPAVNRVTHICCGYPDKVDSQYYFKAPPEHYFRLAPALDAADIDAVSIEDAHRPNDLLLLESFTQTVVILGVIGIARSRIETVDEIAHRLRVASHHIAPERLMAAPDCGLGMLDRMQITAKLNNMVKAARMAS